MAVRPAQSHSFFKFQHAGPELYECTAAAVEDAVGGADTAGMGDGSGGNDTAGGGGTSSSAGGLPKCNATTPDHVECDDDEFSVMAVVGALVVLSAVCSIGFAASSKSAS